MSGLGSEVIFFKSVSDFAVKVSMFGGFLSIAGVIDFVFTLNNKLEQQMIIINKQINKSKQSAKSVTNKHTDNLNIIDSSNALKKLQQDTLLNYSKTNIILFNYLLGSILGIYILRNL